jgi:hypothetical protein
MSEAGQHGGLPSVPTANPGAWAPACGLNPRTGNPCCRFTDWQGATPFESTPDMSTRTW